MRLTCLNWLCLFLCGWLLSSPLEAAPRSHWRFQARLRLAAEYDDNVTRVSEREQSVRDGVLRLVANPRLAYRSRTHLFQFNYTLGLKHFFQTLEEDTLINQASLSYYLRVHPRIMLGVSGNGVDRRRWNGEREYSVGQGNLHLLWFIPGQWQLVIFGGARLYDYRDPSRFVVIDDQKITDNQRYSHWGDQYSLLLRKRFSSRALLSFGYSFTRSIFGFRYEKDEKNSTPEVTVVTPTLKERGDLLHSASLRFRFLYKVLIRASYTFDALQSESFGESYLGHRLRLELATRIFWGFTLLLQGQLHFRTFFDGTTLSTLSQIGDLDENFTSATVRLSRRLWKSLTIHFRYSLYTNQFSSETLPYLRNLASLGISYRF
jgi:hypothetical protein